MNYFFNFFSILVIIPVVLICVFFLPLFVVSDLVDYHSLPYNQIPVFSTNNNFSWPAPGYTKITSNFGHRTAPTSGASTFHSGIDIAAPAGTNVIASISGKVVYTDFYGAGGYTVMIETGNLILQYCHVSPNFLVTVGQQIRQNTIIAKVGPKNVKSTPNNPYKDSQGKPTNGATTGPHLHFSIKKDGKAVNPFDYLSKS